MNSQLLEDKTGKRLKAMGTVLLLCRHTIVNFGDSCSIVYPQLIMVISKSIFLFAKRLDKIPNHIKNFFF